ncbi:MAG: hypothetical protein CFE35_15105 [Novosphingobium sp. PASSN1]|nr:MAG: hypothetical protein CFE35_15105 [Novosphingobium sp. PASSN1]
MQWWSDYFDDVDTMQGDRYGRWFAEDIELQFNNAPAINGKASVLVFLREFTHNFSQLHHSHVVLTGNENHAAGEAVITFTAHDGAQYAVRGMTMVTRKQGLFRRMAIYADFSPLYAALQDKQSAA